MHLYHLLLKSAYGASHACQGSFSGDRVEEVVLVKNSSTIELWSLDAGTGSISRTDQTPLFSTITAVQSYRLLGTQKDYLLVGTDSGYFIVLERIYSDRGLCWKRVVAEPLARSGLRRQGSGTYLAVDPKGRAVMSAGLERIKFVHTVTPGSDAKKDPLVVSSPVEAHRPHVATIDLVAVDVGFENPCFVALEINLEDDKSNVDRTKSTDCIQNLNTYELDLGLNSVVRKRTIALQSPGDSQGRRATKLISIPAKDAEGSGSGVLVCFEDGRIKFHSVKELRSSKTSQSRSIVPGSSVYLPTSASDNDFQLSTLVIVATALRTQSMMIVLLQTETGDVFRVHLDDERGTISRVTHFDIVTPSVSILIFRSGFVFCLSERERHSLYTIVDLEAETELRREGAVVRVEERRPDERGYKCLEESQTVTGLACVRGARALNVQGTVATADRTRLFEQNTTQSDATDREMANTWLCWGGSGHGGHGMISIVTYGMPTTQVASSRLPAKPLSVFTLTTAKLSNRSREDVPYHSLLLLSFEDATLILSIGEGSVAEAVDTGIKSDCATLHAAEVGMSGAILQVTSSEVYVVHDSEISATWHAPKGCRITMAASNRSQVVVVLDGFTIVYMEYALEEMRGNRNVSGASKKILSEFGERKALDHQVTCLSLESLSVGRRRSKFLAVGCKDRSVRILSVRPDNCLQQVSLQLLQAVSTSVVIQTVTKEDIIRESRAENEEDGTVMTAAISRSSNLMLLVGLENGVLVRSVLDATDGSLGHTRLKFIGPARLKLRRMRLSGRLDHYGVLVIADRPWLVSPSSEHQGKMTECPLYTSTGPGKSNFQDCAAFHSDQCIFGACAIEGQNLNIFYVSDFSSQFTAVDIPWQDHQIAKVNEMYTPSDSDGPAYIAFGNQRRDHRSLDLRTALQLPDDRGKMNGASKKARVDSRIYTTSSLRSIDFFEGWSAPPRMEVLQDFADGITCLTMASTGDIALISQLLEEHHGGEIEPWMTQTGGRKKATKGDAGHRPGRSLVVVSTARDVLYAPRPKFSACGLATFLIKERVDTQVADELDEEGDLSEVQLLHETPLETLCSRVSFLGNRVAVATGRHLRLYAIGKTKLLKKCEVVAVPNSIVTLEALPASNRFICGDIQQGHFIVEYDPAANLMVRVAEDCLPRWCLTDCALDYATIAGSDKFGNIWISRLPDETRMRTVAASASTLIRQQAAGANLTTNPVSSMTASLASLNELSKAENMPQLGVQCEFYVGEPVVALMPTVLVPGAPSVLLYVTVSGAMGLLAPMQSRHEVEVMQQLEMLLQHQHAEAADQLKLAMRDHRAYRSMYQPVKGVVDGDLCERWFALDLETRTAIAGELNLEEFELRTKLEELRQRVAF
eukprot:Clim_evm54s109 gene=Clim_evmTU54s109